MKSSVLSLAISIRYVKKGIDKRYFDELAHKAGSDFRHPSITRDMDYVEWLADTMIRVPVAHTLDAANTPIVTILPLSKSPGDDDAAECAHLVH